MPSQEDPGAERDVGERLRCRGETLAVAESCTGGWLGQRLTRVPGSSDYFCGGVISYANQAKVALLGVPERALREHGAVSDPVARAMAEGARRALATTWGLAITGIAGPASDDSAKPVGLVYVALAGPQATEVRELRLGPLGRDEIRWQSTEQALQLLLERL